jgi:hypothetical protein
VGIIDTGKWTKTTRVPPATSSSGVLEVENGVTLDYLKSSGTLATDANGKIIAGSAGGGNVTGPAVSVANHLANFVGTSGTVIADSGAVIIQQVNASPHLFFNSYTKATGILGTAQPGFGDLTGTIAMTQIAPSPSSTTYLRGDGTWAAITAGGNVVGPATSTVGHMATFNNTTGTLLADAAAPQTFTALANQFLTSYSASAGTFNAAQPVFANLGGTIAISQFGATGTPSATTYLRGDNTWSTPGGAGNPPLNTITAATAANTPINNGSYSQTWNWSFSSAVGGLALGESAASTANGTVLQVSTLATSNARPFSALAHNTSGFFVDVNGNLNFQGAAKLVLPNIVSKCLVTDASGNVTGTAGLCLTAPSTTNLLAGDGAGGLANSAIAPGNVATTSNAIALPSATTATTQAQNDNSTKLATTAYADQRASIISIGTQGSVVNAYFACVGAAASGEVNVRCVAPMNMIVSHCTGINSSTQAASNGLTWTFRKNGAPCGTPGNISLGFIGQPASTVATDNVDTCTLAQGDTYDFGAAVTGTASGSQYQFACQIN